MNTFTCPNCGYQHYDGLPQARRLPTRQYAQHRVMSGGGDVITGATMQEFVTPTRAANVESDALTPLLQALVSGSLSSLVVAGVAFIVPDVLPWYSPMAALVFVSGGAWFILLKQTRASLVSIERVEFSPQPQVTAVPQPVISETLHTVRLQVQEDGQHVKYAHLPLPYNDLKVIAKATVNGRPFSLASWAGNGKLLSRSQFETLRDWLLSADYAAWVDANNRNQGLTFTSKGKAFWRGLTAV